MKTMRVAGALRRREASSLGDGRVGLPPQTRRVASELEGGEEVVANMAVRSPHVASFSTHFALRVSLLFS